MACPASPREQCDVEDRTVLPLILVRLTAGRQDQHTSGGHGASPPGRRLPRGSIPPAAAAIAAGGRGASCAEQRRCIPAVGRGLERLFHRLHRGGGAGPGRTPRTCAVCTGWAARVLRLPPCDPTSWPSSCFRRGAGRRAPGVPGGCSRLCLSAQRAMSRCTVARCASSRQNPHFSLSILLPASTCWLIERS